MKKHMLAFLCAILSGHLWAQTEFKDKKIAPNLAESNYISFEEALSKALEKHFSLKLAHIKLEEARAQNAKQVSFLLPKLSLNTGYTRNIPEIKTSFRSEADQSGFYRQVASLVRGQGKTTEADDLDRQADLMGRRNDSDQLIISPKNLFNAGLILEIPLFNGPRLVQALISKSHVDFQAASFEQEKANTLYQAAMAYYRALHLEKVLRIREQAKASIEDQYKKALVQGKRGDRDFLDLEAHFLLRKAELYGAKINYQASLTELGHMMDQEQFILEEPKNLFSALNTDEEQLVSMAKASRTDLVVQKKAMLMADGEKLKNFMQFLPIFTLEGQANYTSNNKGLSKEHFTYAVSLNASLSLFDGGASLISLKETSLKQQAVAIQLSQMEKDIHTSIRMHKEKIEQLKLAVEAYEVASRAKRNHWQSSIDKLARGLIKPEEYLISSEQRLLAELDYEEAQFEVIEQQLALSHEAGLLTSSLQ